MAIDEGFEEEFEEKPREEQQLEKEEREEEIKTPETAKRKSWELTPEQKEEIQISSAETALEFKERENSPQQDIDINHEAEFEK